MRTFRSPGVLTRGRMSRSGYLALCPCNAFTIFQSASCDHSNEGGSQMGSRNRSTDAEQSFATAKGSRHWGGDDAIGESGWTHRLKDSWPTHFGAGISRPRHSVACSGLLEGASAGSCDRLPTTGVLREAKRRPASV